MRASDTKSSNQPNDVIKQFQFEGAYGPGGSKTDVRSYRQPKRRGLWQACFAPPPVKEETSSSAVVSAPSQLALTAKQLLYQRPAGGGASNAVQVPLSEISNVEYKWVEAGGARVSKVTIDVPGKDPLVIRGLKDPQEVVDAINKHRRAPPREAPSSATERGEVGSAGRGASRAAVAAAPAGASTDGPNPRIIARALFTDSPRSSAAKVPGSAANSSCGGMTMLSPFAQSPAQHFIGASSVARELRMASPTRSSSSASPSSAAPEATPSSVRVTAGSSMSPGTTAPQGTEAAARTPKGQSARTRAGQRASPPPPPPVPSDSVVTPIVFSTSGRGAAPSQAARQPAPCTAGGSPPPAADDSVMLSPSQHHLGRCSPSPSRFGAGGSPPPKAEDSVLSGPPGSGTPGSSSRPTSRVLAAEEASLRDSLLRRSRGHSEIQPADKGPEVAGLRQISMRSTSRGQPDTTVPDLAGTFARVSSRGHSGGAPGSAPSVASRPSGIRLRERAASLASFQSADSAELTDRASTAAASHGVTDAGDATGRPLTGKDGVGQSPASQQKQQQEGKNVSAAGALGIAAAAATMSALLTTAASAGLSSVGLAAAPSLTSAASTAAAPVVAAAAATTSVVAAPLTLMGVTAAAAMTLVAAAAVTHIRTGSPVRPLDPPSSRDVREAEARLEARRGASLHGLPPSPPPSALPAPRLTLMAGSSGQGQRSMTQPLDVSLHSPQAAFSPEAPWSWSDHAAAVVPTTSAQAPGLPHAGGIASTNVAVSRWAVPGPLGVHSPASTNNVQAPQLVLVGTHLVPAGAQIISQGSGVLLPVAYAEGVGGNPPAEAVAEINLVSHASAESSRLASASNVHAAKSASNGDPPVNRLVAAQHMEERAEAVPVVHGGELRPPSPPPMPAAGQVAASSAASEAQPACHSGESGMRSRWRFWGGPQERRPDPTARQLFVSESASAGQPPAGQEQGAETPVYASVPYQRSSPGPQNEAPNVAAVAAVGAAAGAALATSRAAGVGVGDGAQQPTVSAAAARRRQAQLTESPVRVLYSVHAAFGGITDGRSPPQQSPPPLSPTGRCESAVQTEAAEASVVESAVQTGLSRQGSQASSYAEHVERKSVGLSPATSLPPAVAVTETAVQTDLLRRASRASSSADEAAEVKSVAVSCAASLPPAVSVAECAVQADLSRRSSKASSSGADGSQVKPPGALPAVSMQSGKSQGLREAGGASSIRAGSASSDDGGNLHFPSGSGDVQSADGHRAGLGSSNGGSSNNNSSGRRHYQRQALSLAESGMQQVYRLGSSEAGDGAQNAGSDIGAVEGVGGPVAAQETVQAEAPVVGAQDWYMSSPGSDNRRASFDLGVLRAAGEEAPGARHGGDDSTSTSCYVSASLSHSRSSAQSGRPPGAHISLDHLQPTDAALEGKAQDGLPWPDQPQSLTVVVDAAAEGHSADLDALPSGEEQLRLLAGTPQLSSAPVQAGAEALELTPQSHDVARAPLFGTSQPRPPLDVAIPTALDASRSGCSSRRSSESGSSSSSGLYDAYGDSGFYTQLGSAAGSGSDEDEDGGQYEGRSVRSAGSSPERSRDDKAASQSADSGDEEERRVPSSRLGTVGHIIGATDSDYSSSSSSASSGSTDRLRQAFERERADEVDSGSGGEEEDEGGSGREDGEDDDAEQWLLSPGVGLSAEPLTAALPSRASFLTPTGPHRRDLLSRSMSSEAGGETEWLPGAGEGGGDSPGASSADSAPSSPRIPPPPPVEVRSPGSPEGSAAAASRSSSVGSCGAGAARGARRKVAYASEPVGSDALEPSVSGSDSGSEEIISAAGEASSIGSAPGQKSPEPGAESGDQLSGEDSEGPQRRDARRRKGSKDEASLIDGEHDLEEQEEEAVPPEDRSSKEGMSAEGSVSAESEPSGTASPTSSADSGARNGRAAPSLSHERSSPSSSSMQTPKRPRRDSGSGSGSASPDLSDISSAAYVVGYGYEGSPRPTPFAAASRSPTDLGNAAPAADRGIPGEGRAGSAGTSSGGRAFSPGRMASFPESDELFHNPLYHTPYTDANPPGASGPSDGEEQAQVRTGAIALPMVPYREGGRYGGRLTDDGGGSSCTSSPGPHSYATSQPSMGSESGALSGGRRRRSRKSPLASPNPDGTPRQYNSGSESEAACGEVVSRGLAAAAAGIGSTCWPRGGAERGAAEGGEGSGTSSGGGSPESAPQPLKRPRMRMPDAPPLPPLRSVPSAPVGPTQPAGPGQSALRRHHSGAPPPLASPLMVLNPTYATSEAGAPSVAVSPRNGPGWAEFDAQGQGQGTAALGPPCGSDDDGKAACERSSSDGAQQAEVGGNLGGPLDAGATAALGYVTPKQQLQLTQGSQFLWSGGTMQGSPSSQQAAHAAALLRHANEAVDFARDAVQRGDGQWLSRVTATLQAVQTALDALREF